MRNAVDHNAHPDEASCELLAKALDLYGARVNDNIDLDKIPSVASRMLIVGRALMSRGDARAFVMGRHLVGAAKVG